MGEKSRPNHKPGTSATDKQWEQIFGKPQTLNEQRADAIIDAVKRTIAKNKIT